MCKVRVAQCVYIALSGSRSQTYSTSIEQVPFVLTQARSNSSASLLQGVRELGLVGPGPQGQRSEARRSPSLADTQKEGR